MESTRNYEKYAWPGGYEIAYVLDDGELLCADCANDPSNPVQELRQDPINTPNPHYGILKNEYRDGWGIIGQTSSDWFDNETGTEYCCHCNKTIGA